MAAEFRAGGGLLAVGLNLKRYGSFRCATDAAGGATELARQIGSSQPSVLSWSKVPTERVLSVEAVMDVARAILWPDPGGEQLGEIDDVDAAR